MKKWRICNCCKKRFYGRLWSFLRHQKQCWEDYELNNKLDNH